MPVPTAVQPQNQNNIWVAAGEGDLDRVKELIENQSISPNTPDPYTYTPMHAAASYGQIHVLEYLVSKGGDVNVKDEDNETPLFTVETVDVARWLVEHGARLDCVNQQGNTPAQRLSEEFPQVTAYIESLDNSDPASSAPGTIPQPSMYSTDQAASELTESILDDARVIMQRAEAEGSDPEAELREMVGRAVLGGVVAGVSWAQDGMLDDGTDRNNRRSGNHEDEHDTKRPRFDDADS